MKNRAKCNLCCDIIESFHSDDYVTCKCGEIYVDAGSKMICGAKNWNNFLRIDDEGNEIIVTVKDHNVKPLDIPYNTPSKKELLDMLQEMITNIERLPSHALYSPITNADHCASLMLLLSILRSD
jgi:hypothetical protein